MRTSGSEFELDPKDADNHYVHLTNNAVQKHSKTYGEFEDGNQMSFQMFQNYIDKHYQNKGINFYQNLLPKMKKIIKHSLLAVRKKLHTNSRTNMGNMSIGQKSMPNGQGKEHQSDSKVL